MTSKQYNICVDTFSDNLYRFMLKSTRDEEQSKDIVQEAYTRMWTNHDNIQYEKAKSYLFTTAYHYMIDLKRKEKRIDSFDAVDEQTRSYERGYSDLSEILEQACNQLPDVQRSAVLLRDYEGYSYEEIGGILSLTESQVKVYIYRARKFLKKYIGSQENVV